jgi:hypothetical protein
MTFEHRLQTVYTRELRRLLKALVICRSADIAYLKWALLLLQTQRFPSGPNQ